MTKKLSQEKREALREESKRIIEYGKKSGFPMQPKQKRKASK